MAISGRGQKKVLKKERKKEIKTKLGNRTTKQTTPGSSAALTTEEPEMGC